ncbi:hypothetical protein GCM10011613_05710 [Cellvibrio zantedeschiae]|uniref:Alpha/beta hydrolase n=1 Tax=Cellvibrio zantedeschiae TaxID=1237077 RepID=A0ABQ3ARA6_9GAMM|nr:hypothetical protein [Cellvibrio zantedeschiae]GGY64769.1 hypothetical protein GCM10011613_05710 [Cellvibrio zantedeschiae]
MLKKFLMYLNILSLCTCANAWSDVNQQTSLRSFKYAPFPLNEKQASTFFDVNEAGRRGHNSTRGGLLWEDTTYNDNRVLLATSANNASKHYPTLIVYLHGNQATLERDVLERQQIPAQIIAADINAFLVAPQFASDALDSSPGNFVQKNYFSAFIREAATQAGQWQNSRQLEYQLKNAPIILVAYSGGYLAAANILSNGGMNNRIKGVILMDALYGQEEIFAKWLRSNHRKSFFFSTYTEPARPSNELLQNLLREQGIKFETSMPQALRKSSISFIKLDENILHKDLLTQAWNNEPLVDLLRKTKTTR